MADDRVNRAVRVAHVVLDNLQHTGSAKPLQRLGLIVLFSHLCKVQCETKDVDDIIGHRKQILF